MLYYSGWSPCSSPSSTGARAKLEPSRAATTTGVMTKKGKLLMIFFQENDGQDKTSRGSSSELDSSSDYSLPAAEYLMETTPQPESLVRLMSLFGMRAKEAQV